VSVSGDLIREPAVYKTGTEAVILRSSVAVGVSHLPFYIAQFVANYSSDFGGFRSVSECDDKNRPDVSNPGCFLLLLFPSDWHGAIHNVPFNQIVEECKMNPLCSIFFERVLITIKVQKFLVVIESNRSGMSVIVPAMFAFGLYLESVRLRSLILNK
jgi:hypothetical protein